MYDFYISYYQILLYIHFSNLILNPLYLFYLFYQNKGKRPLHFTLFASQIYLHTYSPQSPSISRIYKAWNILENYKINYLNAKLATIVFYNFQLFHDRGPYLIETSPNQSTGFYMIGNSVMKELKNPPVKLNQVLRD